MAIYDPYDTVPVRDVDPDIENAGHPLEAIKYAEANEIGPNATVLSTLSKDEQKALNDMIKAGEFNQLEGAILHCIMGTWATLEDLGAMIGSVSRRTKGAATSRPGALKELNRILGIVEKRLQAKTGKKIDLQNAIKIMKDVKKQQMEKRAKYKAMIRAKKIAANKAEQEFYKLLRELRAEQIKHDLPVSKYYVRYRRPKDETTLDAKKGDMGRSAADELTAGDNI